jgi:hypothetical protein
MRPGVLSGSEEGMRSVTLLLSRCLDPSKTENQWGYTLFSVTPGTPLALTLFLRSPSVDFLQPRALTPLPGIVLLGGSPHSSAGSLLPWKVQLSLEN